MDLTSWSLVAFLVDGRTTSHWHHLIDKPRIETTMSITIQNKIQDRARVHRWNQPTIPIAKELMNQ